MNSLAPRLAPGRSRGRTLLRLWLAGACLASVLAQAQPLPQHLKSFGVAAQSGTGARGTLVEGDDGALYGTTEYGGTCDWGTVFKVAKAGTNYTVLRHFTGSGGDGARPYAGLMRADNGMLYGTTGHGGSNDVGTVFRIAQDGRDYAVLRSFPTNAVDGRNPRAGLLQASDGLIYGTTYAGGSSNLGTVFRLGADGAGYTVLRSFTGTTTNGGKPLAALIEGMDGALYGTTFVGGSSNRGTVFKLNKDGTGFSLLRSFTGTNGDGRHPCASLLLASDNRLYGSTRLGGSSNWGTIFGLAQDGGGYGVIGTFTNAVGGRHPQALLVEGSDGALYGTTHLGGESNLGTIFKLARDGSGGVSELNSFSGVDANGANPEAGLLRGNDGLLYGTTYRGGANNYGTLFRATEAGTGLAILHEFSLSGGDGSFATRVFQASDDRLYGITEGGGSNDLGTVFRMTTNAQEATLLHHFTRANADGNHPTRLAEATDGWLYGATYSGGASNLGTVFKLAKDGSSYVVLKSFSGPDGANPFGLTPAADGRLFGTTYRGGTNQNGVAFALNADGTDYAVLRQFTGTNGDGASPGAALVTGPDGVLFGATYGGGTSNWGTLFRLGTDGGNYTVLKRFEGGSNGWGPWGGFVLSLDGALHGTTAGDAANPDRGGAVFQIDTNGSNYRVLHNFDRADFPAAGLLETPNGLLYGTAEYGGTNAQGSIYTLNRDGGDFTELFTLATDDGGSRPQGGLTVGRFGVLSGTTVGGGAMGLGTAFAFTACVAISRIEYAGHAILTLAGAADQSYRIQAAANPGVPAWVDLGANVVDRQGLAQFHDFSSTNRPQRIYRSATP